MTMLPTNVQAPADTSARTALRLACDASHQRMHSLKPFTQIATGTLPLGQYRLLLQSLYQFHSAVGGAAEQSGLSQQSSARQRLDLLRSDLAFVGGAVPEPASNWQAGTDEAVLGAIYVAEGSMLGGRFIARQLDYLFGSQPEGRRFFIGDKCDVSHWSRFVLMLEDKCSYPPTLTAAIGGAQRAFDWFELCVTGKLEGIRPPDILKHRAAAIHCSSAEGLKPSDYRSIPRSCKASP